MKNKTYILDIVFIVVLGIILLAFTETGNLDYLTKLPFVTLLIVYFIGRFVGSRITKSKTS